MNKILNANTAILFVVIILGFWASSGPVQWMDNGHFLVEAAKGEYFPSELGPLSHPFYHMVTTLAFDVFGPFGVAYLNSVLAAVLAFFIFKLGRSLGLAQSYAVLAAATTLFAHCIFWVSSKMEVYTLNAILLTAAYWLYFDAQVAISKSWRIFVVGILTGLGAATHQLTFIVLFPLYLYIVYQVRASVLWALPGFLVGIFPCYVGLINELKIGKSLFSVVHTFMTGSDVAAAKEGWGGDMFRVDKILREKSYVLMLLLSLVGLQFFGLFSKSLDHRAKVLWAAAWFNLLFAISYAVNDRFTFFLPAVGFFAVLAFVNISHFKTWVPNINLLRVAVVLPALIFLAIYGVAASGAFKLPEHSAKLYGRDDVRYFLVPYLPDKSALRFVEDYEKVVPAGSVVMTDWTPRGALASAQVSGLFKDRKLVSCLDVASAAKNLERKVYLVRPTYCDELWSRIEVENAPIGYLIKGVR